MRPVYTGKNAQQSSTEASSQPGDSKTLKPSGSQAKTLKNAKVTKKSKTKGEKSHLTNKFKALLAANLKKHNLGNDIQDKVDALYVTRQKKGSEVDLQSV